MNLTAAMRADYTKRWRELEIRPAWVSHVNSAVHRILLGRDQYERLEETTGVPWYVIGVIHELEASCSFKRHLHNGDPLGARTRNEPKNRPPTGTPPFPFEVSAIDALKYDKLTTWRDWTVAGISWKLESFNGLGYRKKRVGNPYLYSGSQFYSRGKYVCDGVYDPKRVSKQVGCIVLLKALIDSAGISIPVYE